MQNIDINNIVRSIAIAAIGVPIAFSSSALLNVAAEVAGRVDEPTKAQIQRGELTDQLTKACFQWAFSKVDSKLEREAKNTIDEAMGGDIEDYSSLCRTFVRI